MEEIMYNIFRKRKILVMKKTKSIMIKRYGR
jgi:hypothetical protein